MFFFFLWIGGVGGLTFGGFLIVVALFGVSARGIIGVHAMKRSAALWKEIPPDVSQAPPPTEKVKNKTGLVN